MKKIIIVLAVLLMLPILSLTCLTNSLLKRNDTVTDYSDNNDNEAKLSCIREQDDRQVLSAESENKKFNSLIVGFDDAAQNTDVLILVSYDLTDNTVNFMQIPRDTYVNYNGGGRKINSLFAHFLNGGRDKSSALSQLTDFVSENFGISIDCYAAVTISQLTDIVDAIGGVTVNVPFDMKYDDPEQNLHIDIKAGTQTLDGENSLKFIRFRKSYVRGDLARLDAQKIFINALAHELKSGKMPQKIKAAAIIAKDINTNASVTDIFRMYSSASEKETAIRSFTVPGDAYKDEKSGEWYYVVNKKSAENAIIMNINCGRNVEFDKNGVFVSNTDDALSKIYYDNSFNVKIYTEDDIPEIMIKHGG